MRVSVSEGPNLFAAAREELERILDDEGYKSPPRRKKMLRYIVEETLAGRGSSLNAVPISQSVFNRGKNFDHQTDPVVRIEAHRLRRDLDFYYSDAGRNNPVRITIPKRRYVAHFEWANASDKGFLPAQQQEADARNSALLVRRIVYPLATFAVLLVALGSAWFWLRSDLPISSRQLGPSVLVMPFKATGDEFHPDLADGVTHEIVTDLLRFPNMRVVAPNKMPENAGTFGEQTGGDVSYVLEGSIGSTSSNVRVQAKLLRAEDLNVIWSNSYTRALNAGNLVAIEAVISPT